MSETPAWPGPVMEVFADIWCPFAYVGLRTVRRRRDEAGREDMALQVRAWPLELVNGRPLDPAATAEHIRELQRHVEPGLFSGFRIGTFPTSTLPALALASRAYRRSDHRGEEISFALREAVFEGGEDLADPGVLHRLADRLGIGDAEPEDHEMVLAEWQRGQALGVRGSPHFFCAGQDRFCPALEIIHTDGGQLEIRRKVEELESFLAECFRR